MTTTKKKPKAPKSEPETNGPAQVEPKVVGNMKDATCQVWDQHGCAARFEWRCLVDAKVDANGDDITGSRRWRRAEVSVAIMPTEALEFHTSTGRYEYFHKVVDIGDGKHAAVSRLTFDGPIYEDNENDPDPEQRALVKTWRTELLEWLESRPEFGTIDVTTCVSGVCYIRCTLGNADEAEEIVKFTIERDIV